jgi:hypothetical protein
VAALLATRADAYESNAAESRWLLDRNNKDEHEKTFRLFAGKLATLSQGQTFENAISLCLHRNQIMAECMKLGNKAVDAAHKARELVPIDGLKGSIATALDNITFPSDESIQDEPSQSLQTLKTFAVYDKLDARIRELENSRRHDEAVAFCLSMKPGESNWAFFQFDQALGNWLQINENWMDKYTKTAFADIQGLQFMAPLVALLIVILSWLGLTERIREYAG